MRLVLALMLILGLADPASAQPFAWPDGRRAAVALTYDDALTSHLDVAIPALDSFGLKGTFFLSGMFPQAQVERWRAAAANGHELGNHSMFHPCARGTFEMPPQYNNEAYSVRTMLTEIASMNTLLHAIDGRTERAYATPCGQSAVGGEDYIEPLRAAGSIKYVRGIGPPLDPRTLDPFRITSVFFPDNVSGAEMIAVVEAARRSGGVVVLGFHGVGGDYLTVSAEAHRELLAYLDAHERDIWTAPFSEVMDYVLAHR